MTTAPTHCRDSGRSPVSVGFCAAFTVPARRLLLDDSSLTVVIAQQAAALVFAVVLATAVDVVGGKAGNSPG
jgi:hypothetical protein